MAELGNTAGGKSVDDAWKEGHGVVNKTRPVRAVVNAVSKRGAVMKVLPQPAATMVAAKVQIRLP